MKVSASTNQIGDELADYIWLNALSNREVKSVAHSINYRVGFPTFGKKAWLRAQLCFLHAFLGTLALRMTIGKSSFVTESEIDSIVVRYTKRLLSRCIPKQMLPKYKTRMHVWSAFFEEEEPSEAVLKLGTSFYEYLTRKRCDGEEIVLGIRFGRYIALLIGSIENMARDIELVRNQQKTTEPAAVT